MPSARRDEARIALAGAAALALAILATGLAVFLQMQGAMERLLTADLEFDLKSRRAQFDRAIEHAIAQAVEVVEQPNVLRIYAEPSPDPAASHSRAFLPVVAKSLLRSEFRAVSFRDAGGREIAVAGEFVASRLRVALSPRARGAGALLWDGELLLEYRIDVVRDGARLGELQVQHRLRELRGALKGVADRGPTSELALCAGRGDDLHCAPTRFQPEPFDIPSHYAGQPLPMTYALAGGTGAIKLVDYRGKRVVAAYAPLDMLDAGLVLKVDLEELNAPARASLGWFVLILVVGAAAGGWLLRAAVRPLARDLVTGRARLSMALEASQAALWDWDVASGQIYLSERWSEMLGGSPRATETQFGRLQELVHPEDLPQIGAQVRAMLKGEVEEYVVDQRMLTASGAWRWMRTRGRVVARDSRGRALRAAGLHLDIDGRKRRELELAHRADHDPLTGLPNRALFADRLAQALARSGRSGAPVALVYVDVDHFKAVNDGRGHAAGDAVLREVARRLRGRVRSTDTVARFGGDEFALLLEGLASREDGERIAREAVAAMRAPFAVEGGTLSVTMSAGIAFHEPGMAADAAALGARADHALYAAKAAGRDRLGTTAGA